MSSRTPNGIWYSPWIALALALSAAPGLRAASIVDSPHNLSVSGPGTIKAATETRVCIFCHTPHGASSEAPLWNRYSSGAEYTTYDSTTAKAMVGQPNGASKLCLSCHDGTVALGMVLSHVTPIAFSGGVYNMPPGRSNLGTDLADDHPVSFVYDSALAVQNGELRQPGTLTGPVLLDRDGRMQCTTCHDAHDNEFGDFLVQNNSASALCVACHEKNYWVGSSHRTAPSTWDGQGPDPWPHSDEDTVAANACANCHTPHDAGTPERLLVFMGEESVCYSCHRGTVAAHNIEPEFHKASVHPIELTAGLHDPTEDAINPPRHVECVDCHNPHGARAQVATPPEAPGPLFGVKGMNAAGSVVDPLTKGYELCFRCHADSVDRGTALVNRIVPETNTRREFDPGNASYHPVVTVGKNPNVPSLIDPYTESSIIACTDCHNNDQGPGAGGNGPAGPHGSAFEPILERQLVLTDFVGENSGTYAMCYKCHDRDVLMIEATPGLHRKHVVEKLCACTTCHDPHGVAGNTHLINFNPDYVTAGSNGRLEFIDRGAGSASCSLTCHGQDHEDKGYPEDDD